MKKLITAVVAATIAASAMASTAVADLRNFHIVNNSEKTIITQGFPIRSPREYVAPGEYVSYHAERVTVKFGDLCPGAGETEFRAGNMYYKAGKIIVAQGNCWTGNYLETEIVLGGRVHPQQSHSYGNPIRFK